MKAEKGNREYYIEESQKRFYQDRGFDIKDDDSKTIAYGRGKTVPYNEYEKVTARNKELEEQVAELQKKLDADDRTENPKPLQKEKTDKGSSKGGGEDSKKG